jgi:serine protease DegQ
MRAMAFCEMTAKLLSGIGLRYLVAVLLTWSEETMSQTFLQSSPKASEQGYSLLGALDTTASGVFINGAGDVLTARHAVATCKDIYVISGRRVAQATLGVASEMLDLAVLHTSLKPYLSATLAGAAPPNDRAVAVFAEAYSVLQHIPYRSVLLSNALVVQGGERLQLLSGARPGASGSGVFSTSGLLLGVVIERVAVGPGGGPRVLSRSGGVSELVRPTVVQAVPIAKVGQFLLESNVPFIQSDLPQLGENQSAAARAATLSVGVMCG